VVIVVSVGRGVVACRRVDPAGGMRFPAL